jgi:hypothetical protein
MKIIILDDVIHNNIALYDWNVLDNSEEVRTVNSSWIYVVLFLLHISASPKSHHQAI